MLSPTDIHYLVGFLYLASGREDITVVLGEKVPDEASESSRDVDVVIATVASHGLLGVEVKDESRALDTPLVEGLCQKLNDMPSLSRRAIVSTSGYTAPALRKAERHHVECLRLVRGHPPRFQTIDLSQLPSFTVSYPEWKRGPHVALAPSLVLTEEQRRSLGKNPPVRFATGEVVALQDLPHRIAHVVTSKYDPGPVPQGPINLSADLELQDSPTVLLGDHSFVIPNAQVTGVLDWSTEVVPTRDSCYLMAPDGTPFAASVLVAIRTGLFGLTVATNSQALRMFHLPESLRAIRPIRHLLSSSSGGRA